MKSCILFFFIFCLSHLHGQQLQLCFKSTDSAYMEDPVLLSFNVIDKDWANGFVQYKGQKGGWLLTFSLEKIINKEETGKPSQIEYSFNEIKNGKTTGKYFLTIAGSAVVSFYYYDKQRKTQMNFEQVFALKENCGCPW